MACMLKEIEIPILGHCLEKCLYFPLSSAAHLGQSMRYKHVYVGFWRTLFQKEGCALSPFLHLAPGNLDVMAMTLAAILVPGKEPII